MQRLSRIAGVTFAIALIAATIPAVAAREPVDPSTLNPPPADWWTVTCERQGDGIVCELTFTEDPIVDEPSGVICDGMASLVQTRLSGLGEAIIAVSACEGKK